MIQNALATTEQAKPVTVIALRNQARELGIKGFMRMKKAELQKAIHEFLDAQNKNTVNEQIIDSQQNEQNNTISEAASTQSEKKNIIQELAESDTENNTYNLLSQMSDKELAKFMRDEYIELYKKGLSRNTKLSLVTAQIHHRFFLIASGKEVFLNNRSTFGLPLAINTPLITARRNLMIPDGQKRLKPTPVMASSAEMWNVADDNILAVYSCDSEDDMRKLLNTAESLRNLLIMSDRLLCRLRPDVDNRRECINAIIAKILEIKAKKEQQKNESDKTKKQDKSEIAFLLAHIERKRLYAIEAGKANTSEIVQFSREHSHDVQNFNYGVQSMQNILRSGFRPFSPFYAEREVLKGMAAQLGIFRRWDEKEHYCNDDVLRDSIIQKMQSLNVSIEHQQELKPKVLNNEYRNGAWENALQENLELINSCKTRSELTLLLRSFEGATLLEIFRYHHLIPYPYGGGGINDSLTIRDFVEYEFQKREGEDVRTMQPELLIKALPAHASSPIEKIAHDDLNEGIQQEKQRVIEFALALREANDYQSTIQQFDSVRYMNNTVDGFIDTFRMIFDAYDDNHNSENPIVRCEHDSVFRRHVKEQIIFWGRQWAKQDRFSQLKSGKIRQQLQLARLDTWNEIIDDFDGSDSHDNNDDVIDVEFFEVPDKNHIECTHAANAVMNDGTHDHSQQHDDNSHDVTTPITIDEWRKTAADLNLSECFRGLRKFRNEIMYSRKFNRKRKFNPPLRKNTLLPGQITIPFAKPYRDIH